MITYHEGDQLPLLELALKRGSDPITDLGTANAIRLDLYPRGAEGGVAKESIALTVTDGPNGIVTGQPTGTLFDTVGHFSGVVVITWATGEESLPDEPPYLPIEVKPRGPLP